MQAAVYPTTIPQTSHNHSSKLPQRLITSTGFNPPTLKKMSKPATKQIRCRAGLHEVFFRYLNALQIISRSGEYALHSSRPREPPRSMSANWLTWSPFQSPEVDEICAHMTAAEQREAARRGGLYGMWVAATSLLIPLGCAFGFGSHILGGASAAGLIILHIACIPVWQKMQMRFLCSTAWAREQGIRPEQFSLFSSNK